MPVCMYYVEVREGEGMHVCNIQRWGGGGGGVGLGAYVY